MPSEKSGARSGATKTASVKPDPPPKQPPARARAADEPTGDPPPAPPKRKRRGSKAAVTAQIEAALTEVLVMPSAAGALVGDEWLEHHFETQGPKLAAQIAAVSERNESLRRICEKMLEGQSSALLLLAIVGYVYPPLAYVGIAPAPAGLRAMYGMPLGANGGPPGAPPPDLGGAGRPAGDATVGADAPAPSPEH